MVRNEHNHPPAPNSLRKDKVIANMRKRAREETTSVHRIYDEALQEVSQESGSEGIISQLPSLYSLKSSLYRARRERLPPMPSTRADLDLSGEWCTTLDGEKFVLANDGLDDKIVIFATESSLRLLAEATTYFVDGTFSVCPSIFYQVFTIHIMKYDQAFPMVYVLLPNKQRASYNVPSCF